MYLLWASLVAQAVKTLPAMQETGVPSLIGKTRWRGEGLPSPVRCLENATSSPALGPSIFQVLGPWVESYTINLQVSGLPTQTELHQQLFDFCSPQTVVSATITL